jgi:GT2 family glycosyltransferase
MISVIIVNFNGRHFLDGCLSSLVNQSYKDFETILVDNASNDGSAAYVIDTYPWVRLIENKENRGFAGGVNDGIRSSNGEYMLTLNNDTIAEPHFVEELLKSMDKDRSLGMCASKMLFPNGRINSTGLCISRSGAAWDRGMFEEDLGQYDTEREIFGPCAGAALYRKKMLDEIGLFDEDFFLFMEDVDLAFRGRLAGWKCLYVPTARIMHSHGGTAGFKSDLSVYYGNRNLIWVPCKDYPFWLLVASFPWIMGRNLGLIFYYLRQGRGRLVLGAKMQAIKGLGLIIRKRKNVVRVVPIRTVSRFMYTWSKGVAAYVGY